MAKKLQSLYIGLLVVGMCFDTQFRKNQTSRYLLLMEFLACICGIAFHMFHIFHYCLAKLHDSGYNPIVFVQ